MIPNPNMFSPDKAVREQVKKDDLFAMNLMLGLILAGFAFIIFLILN